MMFLVVVLAVVAAVSLCVAVMQHAQGRNWRQAAAAAETKMEAMRTELEAAHREQVRAAADAEKHRELAAAQLRLYRESEAQLEEKFKALASDALHANSQMFLDRSKQQIEHLVRPVTDTLVRFDQQVHALEQARLGAYASLTTQVQELALLQERVRTSTEQLKNALRSPVQRGRWGEVQLRRVVELAGMLEHCDFAEQPTLFGERVQRPDLVVRMPNRCHIAVDAKVPLEAYLRSAEATEERARMQALAEHAAHVRGHLKTLGERAYWRQMEQAPQFVIAFLPLESLYSAALEHDPELIDFAVKQHVILATPSTLIGLLLVVAQGWRQQRLAENTERVRALGSEMYERLLTMYEHFVQLGSSLTKTVDYFNRTVGSLERNVLSSARKFKDLDAVAAAKELAPGEEIETRPRQLTTTKWLTLEDGEASSALLSSGTPDR